VNTHKNLPDVNRFSVVMAMILIAYSLTAVVSFPTQSLNFQLPGFLLSLNFNFVTIISLLVAVLAAVGCNWLISDHPFIGRSKRWQHWLIPALTALVFGVSLNTLTVGAAWWVVFGLGGLLVAGVLVSEYISVDPGDSRSPVAIIGLSAVSLALFLTLSIALRGSGSRLYLILLLLLPAGFLVTMRSLMLRNNEAPNSAWALGITLVILQTATGLYYLPLRPIQFGLILLGLLFALITLADNIQEGQSNYRLWLDPLLLFLLFSISALLV
jgi:hypothetical protein